MRNWFLLAALLPCAVMAQSPLATITGTITDQQQARIPDVEVTAVQLNTNLTYKGVSSTDGTYVIPDLPIGPYEIIVSHAGFKKLTRTNINLEISQRLRVDLVLELGSVNETITVNSAISRVQTESGTLGTDEERERLADIPLSSMDPFETALMIGGAHMYTSNTSDDYTSFNGSPTKGTQWLIDGSPDVSVNITAIAVRPALDTVEEVRVDTDALKAESGVTSGGIVSLVTRAGTNKYHGSLYEYVQNDVLDARNAFAVKPDASGHIKPIVRQNQFGGVFGGPVLIPKVYDGHNRTFFFFGLEREPIRTASLDQNTVPTPAQRNGDFSQTYVASGALDVIYDPATIRANPSGNGFVANPMPGNIVPQSRMDPVSLKVLPYIPLPNTPPTVALTNTLNYLFLGSSPTTDTNASVRIDQRIRGVDTLFFRYTTNRSLQNSLGDGLGPADPTARVNQNDTHNGVLTYTRIISPTVLNDFKVGAMRKILFFNAEDVGKDYPDKLGLPSVFPRNIFPGVTIAGIIPLGYAFASGYRAESTFTGSDDLTIIKGRHTIKLGASETWLRLNWLQGGSVSGTFSFPTSLTGNPQSSVGTGVGMATFLLGAVGAGSAQQFVPGFGYRNFRLAGYVQDDFKVTPRLTLNLGLRYDYYSEPVEEHNRWDSFNPYLTDPNTGYPGVLQYAGVTTGNHYVNPNFHNFGPRFGFAYDPIGGGKTVIRGGYAVVYMMSDIMDININTTGQTFSSTTTFAAPGGAPVPAFQFSVGPSTPLLQPLGASGGPDALIGQAVVYQDRHAPTSYANQWNLTVQRALPGGWTISGSYVGNRGVHLMGGDYNLDQLNPKYWSLGLQLQNLVPNPFYGKIPAAAGALSGATITLGQSLLQYPDYPSVETYANHDNDSIYHSGVFTAEKRYSHGYSVLLAYTVSKLIDDSWSVFSSGQVEADYRIGLYNRNLDRGLDQYDIPQRLVGTFVYELPFGRGKRFLSGAHGVLDQLAAGWQTNAVYTLQPKGFPLQVRGGDNYTVAWPNLAFDPTLPDNQRSANRWFNTSAYQNPPFYVLGDAPRSSSSRDPGLETLDLSVFKFFRIREGMRLQFRADAYNSTNHVNLSPPNVTFSPTLQGVNTNSLFGVITASGPARVIQLGVRLAF